MLKHKLFKPEVWSPFNLSKAEDLPLKANCNQDIKSGSSNTSDKEMKTKNIMATPVTKKKKLDNAESGNRNLEILPYTGTPEPSTSKNGIVEIESDSDLSSFSDDFEKGHTQFFPTHLKLPYTYEEDEMILKFVLREQNIFRVSSISLWKYLEVKKDKPKRTYQSLKNRFMRNIKPHLFTSFKHLIDSKETVEKILIKFPELRMGLKGNKFLAQIQESKIQKRTLEKSPTLNSNVNACEVKIRKREKVRMPLTAFTEPKSENFNQFISDSSKIPDVERIVTLHKNLIKISINYSKSDVQFPPLSGLSERFTELKKNNKRVPCPTCGKLYRRPVSNSSSESSGESDIPNSFPIETDENFEMKNISLISNKSSANSRKINLRSWSSQKSSDSQNLLRSLEKSDKLDENSEESNSLPEDVTEKDDIEKIVEVLEAPNKDPNSETGDKTTENDRDIDLIYEHTVERFQKLIDADEEKTSQRKCLNNDRDSIGFDANAEKNLDSFFLETPLEIEIPTLTPDVQVINTRSKSTAREQSQRITRSSTLASNMMKMMENKTKKRKI